MALIPNYPQALLDEHHHWHDPNAHAGSPGARQNGFGAPGGGLEFLQFHRDYVQRFHAWYDPQPFADQAAVAPWNVIPPTLKVSGTGWNGTRAAQENRIMTNAPPFASADLLGTYIEGGLHGWLHNASATIFNEPILAEFHSPRSTYFYQIHGLVDKWWQQWETAQQGGPDPTPLTVGAPPSSAAIGAAGEVDLYSFAVPAAGSYTIETQGQTDVVVSLHGPNNLAAFVTEDDDSGAGSNARIVSTLSPGTYFLRVRHYSVSATGTYSISVQAATVSIPPIAVNGPALAGVIATANESDLYTFNAATAGLYTVETEGNTDTLLSLFGPNSQTAFIAQDDDSGIGFNGRIVSSLQPGNYFARVRHYSNTSTGPYSIRVRR